MLSDASTSDPSVVLLESGVVPLDATGDPRQIMICGIASWGRMHAAQKEQAGPEAPVQQDPHLVADGVASSVANTTSTQYSLCIPQPVSWPVAAFTPAARGLLLALGVHLRMEEQVPDNGWPGTVQKAQRGDMCMLNM
jgi:hypothetical protein